MKMTGQFKLGTTFTLLLIFIFLGGSILSGTALSRAMQQRAEEEVTARAEILIQTMNSARDYTSTQVQPLLAPRLAVEEEFIRETVPAYAARELFENFRTNPQYNHFFYKEATLNPTNLRDKADSFETQLVEQFRAESDPELSGYRMRGGEKLFYLARPLAVTKASCLECHSTPDIAPRSMIAAYGSQQGFGWQLNEIVAAQTVYVPANDILAKGRQDLSLVMAIFLSIFALVVVLINSLLKRTVIEPIKELTEATQTVGRACDIAPPRDGDRASPLVRLAKRADEPGQLARAFRRMAWQLRESFADLQRSNEVLESEVRKRTADLADAEAELRGLFAAMTEFICTVDIQGRYLKIVATHPTLFSDRAEDLVGKTLDDVFPATQADIFRDRIGETLASQETVRFEYGMMDSNSESLWFAASLSPISEEAVIWVARDMTERKQAEEAVREKEEYLRLILDNIPQQVFWKDTDSIFLGCNKNWALATEVESPEEVVGKTDYDLLRDREIAEFYRRQDRRIIETDTPEFHIVEFKQKPLLNGEPAILDLNKVPIHDAAGKVVGVLGVLEDITKRKQAERALQDEQAKSERLLRNILPAVIVDRLKHFEESGGSLAEQFEATTILFADIVGFTALSAKMHPLELVNLLNQIFSTFDRLAEQHGLEKIKTIGDAYMVVGGLPVPRSDHGSAIAEMALGMQGAIGEFQAQHGTVLQIRIGINTGSVVAGVIGIRKFSYDLWGDAVNIASRMESLGAPGKIQVSEATYQLLQHQYRFEERGAIAVKGKGEMTTYWLLGRQG